MTRLDPADHDGVVGCGARWGFALCCLVSLLRLSPVGLYTVLGVAAALTVVNRRAGASGTWLAFGCAVPLVPSAGDGALLGVGLYAVTMLGRSPLVPRWSGPFVLILLAHLLAGLAVDGYSLGEVWLREGISLVSLSSWWASSGYGVPALGATLRTVLLLGLFSTLSSDSRSRRYLLEGIGWGALMAALLVGALLAFPGGVVLPNETELWRHLRRAVGTFTDPNAFGVAALLLVALLAELGTGYSERIKRGAWWGLAALWCVLASFSGSRVFFLGLGVMLTVRLYAISRRAFAALMVCGFVGIGVAQVVELPVSGLPIGLERLLESLRWDRVGETFHSRTVFWNIGGAVFLDHPWFGVGLGAFWRFVEPYALAAGIPLGGWTDNPNSYYIGILAELGLVGAVAWLLSVRALTWREGALLGGWPAAGVIAFLVMCVVGPHLDFDEVTVLFAALLAGAVVLRERRTIEGGALRYPVVAVGAILLSTIVTQRFSGEWGVYPFETDDIGRFRWSSPTARLNLSCVGGRALLTVRAVHPEIGRSPVRVEIVTALEQREETLHSGESNSITLRCRPEGVPEAGAPDRIDVRLAVTPALIPAHAFGGQDRRPLGVQIRASN